MKKLFIIVTLLLSTGITKAQQQEPAVVPGRDVRFEDMPKFPGGIEKFYQFLTSNIRYPETARREGKQGKVFVSFVIEKDGALSTFKILKGVSPEVDAESIRVLKLSPKWYPGMQNKKVVRMQYVVPISFNLPKK